MFHKYDPIGRNVNFVFQFLKGHVIFMKLSCDPIFHTFSVLLGTFKEDAPKG